MPPPPAISSRAMALASAGAELAASVEEQAGAQSLEEAGGRRGLLLTQADRELLVEVGRDRGGLPGVEQGEGGLKGGELRGAGGAGGDVGAGSGEARIGGAAGRRGCCRTEDRAERLGRVCSSSCVPSFPSPARRVVALRVLCGLKRALVDAGLQQSLMLNESGPPKLTQCPAQSLI
jgi:hypothetical protein